MLASLPLHELCKLVVFFTRESKTHKVLSHLRVASKESGTTFAICSYNPTTPNNPPQSVVASELL